MSDDLLLVMATIDNLNKTLNEIKSILESMRGELHEVDYRTLRMADYDQDEEI